MRTVYTLRGILTAQPNPVRRTRTARLKAAADARKALGHYQDLSQARAFPVDATDPRRLTALLWAKAHIDRALAMETRGAMGDANAMPSSYVRHLIPPAVES